MIISAQFKFLYVGIPKTATHSVMRVLISRYGGVSVGRYHGSHWSTTPEDYLAWAVVRNPYVRLASWWRALCVRPAKMKLPELTPPVETFAAFLWFMAEHRAGADLDPRQGDQRQPQHTFLSRQPCTTFVRYEHFGKDFAELPFTRPLYELGPRRNASDLASKPITEWYDDECLAAAIEYGAKEECRTLGYPEELP